MMIGSVSPRQSVAVCPGPVQEESSGPICGAVANTAYKPKNKISKKRLRELAVTPLRRPAYEGRQPLNTAGVNASF